MRKNLFTLLIVAACLSKAQNNITCYNGGETSPSENAIKENSFNNVQSPNLILMPSVMKRHDVILVIQEKNNHDLNKFLKRRATSNNLRPVGLLSIPSFALGALSLVSTNISDKNNIRSPQLKLGISFLALGAVCVGTGVYFNAVQNKNYKKAIAKYNQLYN